MFGTALQLRLRDCDSCLNPCLGSAGRRGQWCVDQTRTVRRKSPTLGVEAIDSASQLGHVNRASGNVLWRRVQSASVTGSIHSRPQSTMEKARCQRSHPVRQRRNGRRTRPKASSASETSCRLLETTWRHSAGAVIAASATRRASQHTPAKAPASHCDSSPAIVARR